MDLADNLVSTKPFRMPIPEEQHNKEIYQNLEYWKRKKILREVYNKFYNLIRLQLNLQIDGEIVELGSGIGNLKTVIPEAIITDLFPNPWLDQIENAYKLSFKDASVSNIILFDVFHHLQHPGNAFLEFKRILRPGGRVIIFDPDISLLGMIVYGIFHHEPIAILKKIEWFASNGNDLLNLDYYAAQGNANRIFSKKYKYLSKGDWTIIEKKRFSAISYIATGGYSKSQMVPNSFFNVLYKLDNVMGHLPLLFSTRLLICVEKN